MTAIVYLDQEVRKICPTIDGISIGQWQDKSTWSVQGNLTQDQHDAVMALFRAFDKTSFESSQVSAPLLTMQELQTTLVTKGILTQTDVSAAISSTKLGA